MSLMGDDLASIQAHDPAFDMTNFLAHVDQLRLAVRSEGGEQDPTAVTRRVAPGLLSELTSASVEDPAVDATRVVSVGSDASFDTIVVRMHDRAGGLVDWTFQREATATTKPPTEDADVCPHCGAPLKLDAAGACVYCKTPYHERSDWVLVRSQTRAAPTPVTFGAALGPPHSRAGIVAALIGVGVALAAVIAFVIVAVGHSAQQHQTATSNAAAAAANAATASALAKAAAAASAAASGLGHGPLALTAHLTLTGAVSLDPSELNSGELTLNGAAPGTCPLSSIPLSAVMLDVHFDDGSEMKGTFGIIPGLVGAGTADLGTAGAVVLHYTGPTQSTADEQMWRLPAGQAGAVTATTDSQGGGTLKWQQLLPTEAGHNSDGPSSGLLTWTCS